MAFETPNTLRRSSRIPTVKQDAQTASTASNASPGSVASVVSARRIPKRALKPDSHEYIIQMLMKLPGFDFSDTVLVFPAIHSNLATILGAQYELGGHKKPVPAADQKNVAHRAADVIEACVDEWLDNWQDCALTSPFWDAAAERLRCKSKYWQDTAIEAPQVYRISMRYVACWDPAGRGCTEEENFWGFTLGDLTWGPVKAEIDPDLLAKPWDYERA